MSTISIRTPFWNILEEQNYLFITKCFFCTSIFYVFNVEFVFNMIDNFF